MPTRFITHHSQINHRRGFTIVELLIVIVVIGILATITIVAFNGVQNRAQAIASQSALSQASKKLAAYLVDSMTYPADQTAFNNLIPNTGATGFQYSAGANSTSYCLTATTGTATYKADSINSAPAAGACPGHGVGGVAAISNLATNPGAGSSSSSAHQHQQPEAHPRT
jgi:prepilin-type N-terminal cleavage/methylation domain-containing protein